MSDLIVVTYPDEYKAGEVLGALSRLEKELLLETEDAAFVVKRQDGSVKVHETMPLTRFGLTFGMARGTFWGALIGLLFMQPALGALTGAALGGTSGAIGDKLASKLGDCGIPNEFVNRLADGLKNGTSALFVLVRRNTPEKVVASLEPYGGTILHSTLSAEAEAQLQAALSGGKAAGA